LHVAFGNISFFLCIRQDFNLKLIASCIWWLQSALNLMDHNDIIMRSEDAEVQGWGWCKTP
jgi:hypothetical protein